MQAPAIYGPLWHVHVDLAGPFRTPQYYLNGQPDAILPETKAWVVMIVDYFTKVAEFVPVYSKEPVQIAQAFYAFWVCRYGAPKQVTTDNGTEFAQEFGHMLARLGCEHITTSVRHPQANGAVERLVQSFKSILKKHVNNHVSSWLKALPSVRLAYMNRIHSAIGVSPNEMLMGFRPNLPLPVGDSINVASISEPSPAEASEYITELRNLFAELDQSALDKIEAQFHHNALEWSQRQAKRLGRAPVALQVGDLVLELDAIAGPLRGKARGPYTVKAIRENGVVTLTTGDTSFKQRRDNDRHISLLSKYYDKQNIRLQ